MGGCIFHEPQRSPARRDVTISEMKRAEQGKIICPPDVVLNATAILHAARVFKHQRPLNYLRSERVMNYDAPAAADFQ